jgi:hypothetical protein
MNKGTGLSLACYMNHHDICKINIENVRKCKCNCQFGSFYYGESLILIFSIEETIGLMYV